MIAALTIDGHEPGEGVRLLAAMLMRKILLASQLMPMMKLRWPA